MTHKPSPKAMTEFFARNTGIARIGTWEQLQEKLKKHGQGVDLTPAYAMNLIVDDLMTYAYAYVQILPETGKDGILYITPDGSIYIWIDGEYKTVGAQIDLELSEESNNAIANSTVTKKINEIDNELVEVNTKLDTHESRIETAEEKLASIVNSGSKVFRTNAVITPTIGGSIKLTLPQFEGAEKSDIVIDTTLIVDKVGTLGVVTVYSESKNLYNIRTINTSFTGRQGVRLGTVEAEKDLPKTVAEAEAFDWQTPVVGDFAYVRTDSTHKEKLSEWVITEILNKKDITWSYSHFINQGDYQEQSSGSDAGKILTAGSVDGTFGEPIDPETLGGRPDWNVNDAESKDFIKNRTHYIDEDGEYVKLDSQYINIGETMFIDEDGKLQSETGEEMTPEDVQNIWYSVPEPGEQSS